MVYLMKSAFKNWSKITKYDTPNVKDVLPKTDIRSVHRIAISKTTCICLHYAWHRWRNYSKNDHVTKSRNMTTNLTWYATLTSISIACLVHLLDIHAIIARGSADVNLHVNSTLCPCQCTQKPLMCGAYCHVIGHEIFREKAGLEFYTICKATYW